MKLYFLILFVNLNLIAAGLSVIESELDKNWKLENENGTIKIENISLPSGIFSAYAKLLGLREDEILYSKNDVNWRWLAEENWTYSTTFSTTNTNSIKFINLVFYGIDTIANITLNDHLIGQTDNMFVRYVFEVQQDKIISGFNVLKVKIKSPILEAKERSKKWSFTPPECPPSIYNGECHMNMLRKMQASFGWDWGLAAPSMGIWKRVTLEQYDVALIRDIDVTTEEIPDTNKWKLGITVDLESKLNDPYYGELIVYAVEIFQDKTFPKNITFDKEPIINNQIKYEIIIDKNNVELWWPNTLGEQKLYNLHFTFNGWTNSNGSDPRSLTYSQKSIRIGFRKIELIQDKMENGLSFYFKVNNESVFMRGTNYIPSHILPELLHDQNRVRNLMASVKTANMNMIRVWGGGVYESDFLYDLADTYGILIWQDMMFGCAMYPVEPEFLESVRTEVSQNIKRIAHHASIAIIAGNNENEAALIQNWYGTITDQDRFKKEYRLLYNATINDELRKFYNHKSRPNPLTSSPSNGDKTIQDNFISKQPQDPNYGDIHFYEYFRDWSDSDVYPIPRFSSEYGFQSLPAITSWKKTMGKHDTLKDLISHRQHLPGGEHILPCVIFRQLPLIAKDHPDYDEYQIYFSQIAQAMATKFETEILRKSRNTKQMTMGALYWQLNDVWVAPSWSSIDFNGNYKILHYWARDFMSPVSVIAHGIKNTKQVEATVIRDTVNKINLPLTIIRNIYLYRRLAPGKKAMIKSVTIAPNTVLSADKFELEADLDPTTYFYEILLKDQNRNEIVSRTYYFPAPIKHGRGIRDPNVQIEIYLSKYKEPISSVSIAIKIDYPALFVYLELDHENITHYKLSENGFIQIEPIKVVYLEFLNEFEIKTEHIKVHTVNHYMSEHYPTIEADKRCDRL